MLIGYEGDTPQLEDDAKGVLSLLWAAYPGHPWYVKCGGGIIFIRHMDFPGNWGMVLRVKEFDHDAAVMKKKIIMLSGEWLERANQKRGRHEEGQETKTVDGVKNNRRLLPERQTDDVNISGESTWPVPTI